MARLCVLICRIDDENAPDHLTQLKRVDLPALDGGQLTPDTALDQVEAQAVKSGQEVIRHLLSQQWQVVEEELAADALRLSPPGNSSTGRR